MKRKLFTLVLMLIVFNMNAQKIDRSKMPISGPAPSINMGKTHEVVLKNGLKVIIVENHKLPRASARLTIDNPLVKLGDQKGVETLFGSMLGNGTKNLSKDDFNKKVDFLGASVSYWDSGASMQSLSKYFSQVLALMADGIINPKFTTEDFDSEKAKNLEALKSDEKNVEAASNRVSKILLYGKEYPYSEFDTADKIQKVTLDDVQKYYNTYYRPNNAYLVIVGDVDPKKVEKEVKKLFADWKVGDIPASAVSAVESKGKTEVDIINMPNAVQSIINIVYPINLTKNDADYFPLQVASNIFGGDFNSYLNMNLREAHGWTYGARGGVKDDRYIGNFYATAKVRNEVTDSAVVESLKEIANVGGKKVDNQVLEDVKAKFLGNFILSLERPETVANQALMIKTNKLPADFYKNYIAKINAVTADDVQRVGRKYFSTDNARITVAGKGEQIYPGLSKLGYKVNFYDNYGNAIENPANAAKNVNVTTKEVFDKYFVAIGGLDKVKKVTSLLQTGKISLMGQTADITTKAKSPNKKLMSFNIMGMEIKDVFNGTTGYSQQGPQKAEKKADEIENLKSTNSLFSALGDDAKTAKVVGQLAVDGVDTYKVESYAKDQKTVLREDYFSVKDGLLIRTVDYNFTPQGVITNDTTYGNYQEINGVKFPTNLKIEVAGGQMAMEINFDKTVVNKDVSDADFQ